MWPAAIQNHLNDGLPMKHEWAIEARVRAFSDNSLSYKGLWTGDYDLQMSIDGRVRDYEGAIGGIQLQPIRYRVGTIIMTQEVSIGLAPEAIEVIRGYNTKIAPIEIHCLCWDSRNMSFLGTRRFVRGYLDGANIVRAEQGGTDQMRIKIVSVARKGTMTTTGKKSHESQKQRSATDKFRKYSDLGRVASDSWGAEDET